MRGDEERQAESQAQRQADALDRAWDALADRAVAQPPSDAAPAPDPALLDAVLRLHDVSNALDPEPTFLRTLREDLMQTHPAAGHPTPFAPAFAPTANGYAPTARLPARPAPRSARPRPWTRAVELAAVAALILAILGGTLLGTGNLPVLLGVWQNDDEGGTAMFLGNAARTGEMPGPGPEGEPGLRWRQSAAPNEEGSAYVPPLVASGLVYVHRNVDTGRGSTEPILVALDPVTGEERWRIDAIGTASVVSGGSVFLGRAQEVTITRASPPAASFETTGALLAYDAVTGEERWRFDTDAALLSPLAAADGAVYAASLEGTVYAVDAEDGGERWVYDGATVDVATARWLSDAPAVADGVVYIVTSDAEIVALDARTGDERWRAPTGAAIVNTPVVADGVVYATGDAAADPETEASRPRVFAFDAATGHERWARDLDREAGFGASIAFDTPPAIADGNLILTGIGTGANQVRALDPVSGDERWRFTAAASITSPPAVVGETLYVGSNDANLYALDAASGNERWRVELAAEIAASPAVAGGALFVTDTGGTLYALGGTATGAGTPAASPVPTGDASGLGPCEIEPRPELAIDPEATPVPGLEGVQINRPLLTGTPVASVVPVTEAQEMGQPAGIKPEDLPPGKPVHPTDVAGITETLEQLIACSRPSRERQAAAFYSDDYFRRPWVVWQLRYNGYGRNYAEPALPLADVRLLPDGRVGVLDQYNPEFAFFLVFVEQDGRWLVDEILQVSDEGETSG